MRDVGAHRTPRAPQAASSATTPRGQCTTIRPASSRSQWLAARRSWFTRFARCSAARAALLRTLPASAPQSSAVAPCPLRCSVTKPTLAPPPRRNLARALTTKCARTMIVAQKPGAPQMAPPRYCPMSVGERWQGARRAAALHAAVCNHTNTHPSRSHCSFSPGDTQALDNAEFISHYDTDLGITACTVRAYSTCTPRCCRLETLWQRAAQLRLSNRAVRRISPLGRVRSRTRTSSRTLWARPSSCSSPSVPRALAWKASSRL